LLIREARPGDAEALAALLTELGFPAVAGEVAERLPRLQAAGEVPLVAEAEGLLGCIGWHVMHVVHRPLPVGRITMLIVAEAARGQGVGKALVEAAEARLEQLGCGIVEVTSNAALADAHLFYERLGYRRTSHRFAREVGGGSGG
jgi:GNAT superfamily N-acetyltransferase